MADRLLPPNASPLEVALEQAMAHDGDEREVVIDTLWRPRVCPVEVLPFLAWGLGVKRWDPDWPETTRRQVVANAIEAHRRRGTLGAVRRALADIGAAADVEERPGGDPFRMRVSIFNSATLLGRHDLATVREHVDDAKRHSVHYDVELFSGMGVTPISVAAGAAAVQLADVGLVVNAPPPPLVLDASPIGLAVGVAPVPVGDFTVAVNAGQA